MHWGNTAEQGCLCCTVTQSYAKHAVRDCDAGVRASTCCKCAAMFMLHGTHGVVTKAAHGAIMCMCMCMCMCMAMGNMHWGNTAEATKRETHALRIKVTKWWEIDIQNKSVVRDMFNNCVMSS